MMGEPLRSPSTLRQAVVDRLRDAIVSGTIAPGTLLRETALAASLNVSATPIREALGTLASEGLVEIEAHRLKRVTPIDFPATRDLLRVQWELWRLGYAWGMGRIGAGETALLDQAIARYRMALDGDDYAGAIAAGLDFHTIFITASANRELLRSTLDRRGLIARFILLHGLATLTTIGLEQHQAILTAFKAGDHPGVLACLDRMATRLIAIADAGCPAASDHPSQ
jgi:DNA-binding GntR family transcriptional regulator